MGSNTERFKNLKVKKIMKKFDSIEMGKLEISRMNIPTPSIPVTFTMMQKLFAYWVKEKHYYGNWSGTGVGKTYSFILASRVIDAHLTIVIGTNSTTHQLANEIEELYNDSVVEVYENKLPDFDMNQHNYLIFNYEKGQQEYSQELLDSVLEKYKVDYIVFDEVQMIKQKGKIGSTRRMNFKAFRDQAVEKYNSYVSVLTATPYTNSLSEVISILSLLTGEDYSYIATKNNLKNTIEVENLLNSLGVCANTEAKNIFGQIIKKDIQIVPIYGSDSTFENFRSNLSSGPLQIYQSTLQEKLGYIMKENKIQKGELTIIYTQFTGGIIQQTKSFLEENGFKVCEYTGENKDTDPYTVKGKVDWQSVKEHYDVILASKPIAVGVDGLQKVSNKMIILTLPWTDSDYKQLIGRLVRKQSNFNKVEICVPLVTFKQAHGAGYDDKVWQSIQNKGIYSNACLYGEFPKEIKSVHKSIVDQLMTDVKANIINNSA